MPRSPLPGRSLHRRAHGASLPGLRVLALAAASLLVGCEPELNSSLGTFEFEVRSKVLMVDVREGFSTLTVFLASEEQELCPLLDEGILSLFRGEMVVVALFKLDGGPFSAGEVFHLPDQSVSRDSFSVEYYARPDGRMVGSIQGYTELEELSAERAVVHFDVTLQQQLGVYRGRYEASTCAGEGG